MQHYKHHLQLFSSKLSQRPLALSGDKCHADFTSKEAEAKTVTGSGLRGDFLRKLEKELTLNQVICCRVGKSDWNLGVSLLTCEIGLVRTPASERYC